MHKLPSKELPTQKELHSIFRYDNGNLIWKTGKRNGKIAGYYNSQGYIIIDINYMIDGISIKNGGGFGAHRLIYKYHHGEFDINMVVDHIDHQRDNNKIENLQLLTLHENCKKKKKLINGYPTPAGGYKGGYNGVIKFPGFIENNIEIENHIEVESEGEEEPQPKKINIPIEIGYKPTKNIEWSQEKRWSSSIKINDELILIGHFNFLKDAIYAQKNAEIRIKEFLALDIPSAIAIMRQ